VVILEKYGMYSAIVDAFDDRLTALCKGEVGNIKKIILDVVDGKEVDQGSLSKEETDYLKTAKVIMGHSLYSDSWLEI
jgi:5-methyltetrahydrofolate corrinoid/iron sulfur protein methyltransferase